MMNALMLKMRRYVISVTYAKRNKSSNDSYKIDSSIQCGEDTLPGATRRSREVVNKHVFRIVSN
jgi:hypothetical protein